MSQQLVPQPIRGTSGASDLGPRNIELDRQNPDILLPPETDNGSLPNLKFSFALAHNRLEDGGWARAHAAHANASIFCDCLAWRALPTAAFVGE
jgi:hypothetical protein